MDVQEFTLSVGGAPMNCIRFGSGKKNFVILAGMSLSGKSPDGRIVEMMELPDRTFYIGTQAHPEFKSRPNKAHPLFAGFIAAAVSRK